jgi:hypothetical protein
MRFAAEESCFENKTAGRADHGKSMPGDDISISKIYFAAKTSHLQVLSNLFPVLL